MRIRMRTTMAGPGGNAGPGDVIDRPKAEAYALIEGGFAEQIEAAPTTQEEVETATVDQPEAAVTRRSRSKPRRRKSPLFPS